MDLTTNRSVLGSRIEDSPVNTKLSRINRDCQRHGQPLRLELAETTVDTAYSPSTDLEDVEFQELILWSPYPLDDLFEYMPQSVFTELPHRYDEYETVDEDCRLRFRFNMEHRETKIVPTTYSHLQLEIPTVDAHMEAAFEMFAVQERREAEATAKNSATE